MFTRNELVAELSRLAASGPLPLEVEEFGHQDFTSPCSEQSIEVYRGSKEVFASGLLFWIKTLQAQDWSGRQAYFVPYVQSGLCEAISEKEFFETVAEYSRSLREAVPGFLVQVAGFQSGLRMYSKWNDVGVVAELADAFVAFFWSTTA